MAKKLKIYNASFDESQLWDVSDYLGALYCAGPHDSLKDAAIMHCKDQVDAHITALKRLGPKAKGKKHGRA